MERLDSSREERDEGVPWPRGHPPGVNRLTKRNPAGSCSPQRRSPAPKAPKQISPCRRETRSPHAASYIYGDRNLAPYRQRYDLRQLRAQRGTETDGHRRCDQSGGGPERGVGHRGVRSRTSETRSARRSGPQAGLRSTGMKTPVAERVDLPVSGMTCAACARAIERTLSATAGVERASVNLATNTATVEFDAARTGVGDFITAIEDLGYGVPEAEQRPEGKELLYRTRLIVAVLFAVPVVDRKSTRL